MQKALPVVIIVIVVLGIIGGGFFAYKQITKPASTIETEEETETLKELSLEDKPYTTLVPGPSCEFTLSLSGIQGSPESVEYEIVYKNEEGVTQGASGTIKASGESSTKKLLFGTESSGHRRCDKGVSGGNITIRFRNDEGKLIAKMESSFSIAEDETELSVKGLKVEGLPSKGKHLAMKTFGLPENAPGKVEYGPFGVFSNSKSLSGSPKMEGSGTLYGYDGSEWMKISGKTSALEALILSQ
ncbi:MAG: hypothetical protein AAB599_03280 [Patescibacteria group bacterium]